MPCIIGRALGPADGIKTAAVMLHLTLGTVSYKSYTNSRVRTDLAPLRASSCRQQQPCHSITASADCGKVVHLGTAE
jgi:hypothetical protein